MARLNAIPAKLGLPTSTPLPVPRGPPAGTFYVIASFAGLLDARRFPTDVHVQEYLRDLYQREETGRFAYSHALLPAIAG